MGVALVAYLWLPDFPHNTWWGFSAADKQLAVQRMTEDVGMKDDTSKVSIWEATKLALGDYKRASSPLPSRSGPFSFLLPPPSAALLSSCSC